MTRAIRTCANCGAWQEPADEELLGTCRLNPPILDVVKDETTFPSTPPHWWCAKWISQRKLAAVPSEKEDA